MPCVAFNEAVLVSRLPTHEFLDAHKARIAPKAPPVPFSDEIWDGSQQNFRDVELTPQEFALLKASSNTAGFGGGKPLNKFARLVNQLVVLGGMNEDIDRVKVKRVDNAEYDLGGPPPTTSALTKAVAVGYDEHGMVIWEEMSIDELQRHRGSLRRFQPSAPPLETLPPQQREASSSTTSFAPAPPAYARDAASSSHGVSRASSNPDISSSSTNNNLPSPPSTPTRKTTYNVRSSSAAAAAAAATSPSPSLSASEPKKFQCGEHRIEFVANEPLQAGGAVRGRAANVEEDDLDALFPVQGRKTRSRSLIKVFKSVFSSSSSATTAGRA